MTPVEVTVSEDREVAVAAVDGEIDASNLRMVDEHLTAAVSNRSLGLVVDLSEVGYMDSAGVGLLFDLARRLDIRRQRLGIAVPEGSPLRRLLQITSLDRAAVLRPSTGDCVEELRRAAGVQR